MVLKMAFSLNFSGISSTGLTSGKVSGKWEEQNHSEPTSVSKGFPFPPDMPEAPAYLSGFQHVVEAFGHWPGFHDSPVLAYTRTADGVGLEVEAWEMTPEVDAQGYFILAKRHYIGFRFTGITAARLEGFTDDNILFGLIFSPVAEFQASSRFRVTLDSAMGGDMDGWLEATGGEVTFVRPSLSPDFFPHLPQMLTDDPAGQQIVTFPKAAPQKPGGLPQ